MRSSNQPLRVLHLSTYASGGGAARAAYALHQAQLASGMDSAFIAAQGTQFTIAKELDRNLWRLQKSPLKTWRSPARFGSITAKQINQSSADVVNLHWVTDGFLTIEQIGKITKPLVWSLYDMWPFTGTEHYGTDTPGARWRAGYTKSNRPSSESGFDLDRWTWQRKQRNWQRPMEVIAASTWMHSRVTDSALMNSWPTQQIPHVVDTNVFSSADRSDARKKLGLSHSNPIVLFLSSAGIDDTRKGFDLLKAAWPQVHARSPEAQIMVIGPESPTAPLAQGLPIIWRGPITNDATLALHYSAADVVAVPSREDNMPLSAMEAQSCGRAVVAFEIGGLPDIVEHVKTGYLAQPNDISDLAAGLVTALQQSTTWGNDARSHAVNTWSNEVIASAYERVYRDVLA